MISYLILEVSVNQVSRSAFRETVNLRLSRTVAYLFLGFGQIIFKFVPLLCLYTDGLPPFCFHLVNQSLLVHSTVGISQERIFKVL